MAIHRDTLGRYILLVHGRGGIINFSSFERTIEFIRVDGDLTFIMGAETVKPIGDSPQAGQTVRRRFTSIWKNEAGT